MSPFVIWWCRRDIRLEDNSALYRALQSGFPVQPIFIFDKNILDDLQDSKSILTIDKRVEFIYNELNVLNNNIKQKNSSLWYFYGSPLDIWQQIIDRYGEQLKGVFTNRDYEPYAIWRDKQVEQKLSGRGISYYSFKDQCIFEYDEVLKDDNKPYTVFTPYSRKWKTLLTPEAIMSYPGIESNCTLNTNNTGHYPAPSLEFMGFITSGSMYPSKMVQDRLIRKYSENRDYPALDATSRIGVHLRFGTISIRKLVKQTIDIAGGTFLNELIWREFYMMILANFPNVVEHSFRPEYDRIPWRNNKEEFQRWCEGNTGYPVVDAGMRELNATGFMHNRVRMITASFLTKHLLIDWRWGEAYFAKKLLDYELASNNGGWQWAAGTGCDAAPYFRVFNPYLQALKFDSDQKYIRHWVPELDSPVYPMPMVDHAWARNRAIEVYKNALKHQ